METFQTHLNCSCTKYLSTLLTRVIKIIISFEILIHGSSFVVIVEIKKKV